LRERLRYIALAMHTPGHAVVNLALIGASTGSPSFLPIVLGAVLPDLPIVVLYIREHHLHHVPDEVIWREHYQRPFWQNLIHGMHSFPLATAGLALAVMAGSPAWTLFFASALLHALADFPIHVHDAHRHFWPLSNYRFISRISYWDLRYHARSVAAVELLGVGMASAFLWIQRPGTALRAMLLSVGLWYAWSYVRLWVSPAVEPFEKKS